MGILFSEHAKFEMERRKIDAETVRRMVKNPQQEIAGSKEKVVIQGKYQNHHLKKEMLLRIIGRRTQQGFFVITAYKTSKTKKYWLKEDNE